MPVGIESSSVRVPSYLNRDFNLCGSFSMVARMRSSLAHILLAWNRKHNLIGRERVGFMYVSSRSLTSGASGEVCWLSMKNIDCDRIVGLSIEGVWYFASGSKLFGPTLPGVKTFSDLGLYEKPRNCTFPTLSSLS